MLPSIATFPSSRKPLFLDCLAAIATLCFVFLIEECRYLGLVIPVPFLLTMVVVLLSASYRGLRAGWMCASVWAVYLTYAALLGFAPKALAGGVLQISTAIAAVYLAALIQGSQKDRNTQLLKALKTAYQELDLRFEENSIEFNDLEKRYQTTAIALQKSQRRYQSLAEAAPVGIFRTDAIGNCIYVNEKWCAMSGLSSQQAMGQGWTKALHPDDRDRIAQAWYQAAEDGALFQAEYRFQSADGRITCMVGQAVAEKDETGAVVGYVGTITDISDRKQAELALQESESFLQAIVERSGIGIAVTDVHQQFRFVKTNPAFQQMLGYSDAQLRSLSVLDITHQDDLDLNHRYGASLFAGEFDRAVMEKRYYHQSGDVLWARTTISLIRDQAGQPKYGIGIIENITDRKLAEAALRDSEERWQLAIAGNNDGIWDHNLSTNEHFLSDRCYEMLGYAPQELDTFDKWLSYIHPDDVDLINTAFQKHLNQETDYYSCEYRIRDKSGQYVWILARGKALWDNAGKAIRAIGSITDVSDRKLTEVLRQRAKEDLEQRVIDRTVELLETNDRLQQELQERQRIENRLSEAEHRWRTLLEEVPLLVVGLDLQGRVDYLNPHALDVIGYSEGEIFQRNWHKTMLPRELQAQERFGFRVFLKEEKTLHHSSIVVTKTGERRHISWLCTILRNAEGDIIGSMSVGEDITDRLRIEQMKNEFVSIVSHELRTPLTSIYSALNLLADEIIALDSERGKRTIAIAAEGAERLTRLVNDILDLERLESGKLTLTLQSYKLMDLLDQATELLQVMADRAGITFSIVPLKIDVFVDVDRIIQVLTNLLSNAIKFSSRDSTVEIIAQRMQSEMLQITVKDQGRGIPSDQVEKVFDRFHQVDASDARSNSGTGLGLAICRTIVQQHGGKIWVDSVLGEGSEFHFVVSIA